MSRNSLPLASWIRTLTGIPSSNYARALGVWGWALYVASFGSLIGIAASLAGVPTVPLWVWVVALVVTAVLAPFQAFHSLRVKLGDQLDKANAGRDDALEGKSRTETRFQERFSELEQSHKEEMSDAGRQIMLLKYDLNLAQTTLNERTLKRELLTRLSDLFLAGGTLRWKRESMTKEEFQGRREEIFAWCEQVNAILDNECFAGARAVFVTRNVLPGEQDYTRAPTDSRQQLTNFVAGRQSALQEIIKAHFVT